MNLYNDKFHGWWQNTTTDSMNEFMANGTGDAMQDQYIYIDTKKYPIRVETTYGTKDFILSKSNLMRNDVIENNEYIYKSYNELINIYNQPLCGDVKEKLSFIKGNTLKLLDDETISSYLYQNYNYFGEAGYCIYKKMKNEPIDNSLLDWNNPVNLFKYYISANTFSNISTNCETKSRNYVGKKKEQKITDMMINNKIQKTTKITKIRITNSKYYSDINIPKDKWTTIYTENFSYATPGSNIKIRGAGGHFSILNGTYKNGVGLLNAGANLLINKNFIDEKSYYDLFNSFLLDLDTSPLNCLADPETGWINLPDGITVTVKHSINSNSTYNEFCAACATWFYKVFRTATHVERNIYTGINSCKLINTFDELREKLKSGKAGIFFQDSMRYGQPFVSGYYHNFFDYRNFISRTGPDKTGGLQNMVNCPYPVNYYNDIFKYDVALGNYLVGVKYLVFTIKGVLEKDQPDPKTFDYPYIFDKSSGRAHFESSLIDAVVINGVIKPYVPKGYASIGVYGDDNLNINSHYFGQIDPCLTKGRIVGYLYKRDCKFLDPNNFMDQYGMYNKEPPNSSKNPRIYREGLSAIYSTMMKYFNDIGCETIIIDQCGNLGGDFDLLSIIEFMGGDRKILKYNSVDRKDNLFPYNDSNTVSNAAKKYEKGQNLYVSLNEKFYPGSVFKGNKYQTKNIIFLTDIFSRSAGDISPNFFSDKHLGSYTKAHIIGCLDGREFSSISEYNSLPININPIYEKNNLIDHNGNQVSPFTFNIDWGRFFLLYSNTNLSMTTQNIEVIPEKTRYSRESNALPISFEDTVFQDFGFIPITRKKIPDWRKEHPKKPNPNDRSSWRYMYLDAAILYFLNNIKQKI